MDMHFNYDTVNISDIAVLAHTIRSAITGVVIPYSRFSDAIRRPILEHRYLLNRARNIVEREDKVLINTVRGVGLIKLEPDKTTEIGEMYDTRIKGLARNGFTRLSRVSRVGMSNETKKKVYQYQTKFKSLMT